MTIRYLHGDATAPHLDGCGIVAHICNDIGAWNKGFVRALAARWPETRVAYRRWYRQRDFNDFRCGAVQLVPVAPNLFVANMIAQRGIFSRANPTPIDYDALGTCLDTLADHALAQHAHVHMPRIGTGLAGGHWTRIEPLITTRLCDRQIPVTVYDLP